MAATGDEIVAADITTIEDYTIRRPLGRLEQAAAQSIPDATLTALTWTTEDIDTHTQHDTATNNTRVTPNIEGYYEFNFGYYTATTVTPANLDASIRKNGSSATATGMRTGNDTTPNSAYAHTIMEMNGTTDYVEFMGFQDSSGAVNTNASGRFRPFCTWKFLRPL